MLVMFHMLLCLLCGCFWCCHSISCRCLTYEEGQYDAFDADSASIGRRRFRPNLSNFMLKFPDLKGSESVSSKCQIARVRFVIRGVAHKVGRYVGLRGLCPERHHCPKDDCFVSALLNHMFPLRDRGSHT